MQFEGKAKEILNDEKLTLTFFVSTAIEAFARS